jgi:hypothetical protein
MHNRNFVGGMAPCALIEAQNWALLVAPERAAVALMGPRGALTSLGERDSFSQKTSPHYASLTRLKARK